MEKKKVSLVTYVVSLIIILTIIVVFVIVKGYTNKNTTENIIENVSREDNIIKDTGNKIIYNTEYIEIQIEDTKAQGLAYKEPVKIYDTTVISKIEEIINLGVKYEPKSTAWPDISPKITFYIENGEKYIGFTASFLDSNEEHEGFYITIFNDKNEEETKTTYKIKVDLDKYLTLLYEQFGKDDYIVLYHGIEIEKNVGLQKLGWIENTSNNKERYNMEYFIYEKDGYKGNRNGTFGVEETYKGYSYVDNVGTFSISKKYDAIPRKASKVKKLPEQLNDMMDLNSVEIETIDLDGNGKNEYIVCVQHTTLKKDYDIDENEAYSELMLFDSNYKKIATLATRKDNWDKDKSKVGYIDISDVIYIDIDNDNVMEIIISLGANFEYKQISILKYQNGNLKGETDVKVDIQT